MQDISYKKYRIVLKSGYNFEVVARNVSIREFDSSKVVCVQFQSLDQDIYVEHLDSDDVAAVFRVTKE